MSAALWTAKRNLSAASWRAPSGAARHGRRAASRSTRARSQPGDLFFAINGETHDGHDHVARAFAAGAAAAVVRADARGRLAGRGPVFAVDETLRAMERLGRPRARAPARIAAVTGSVGKTSDQGDAAAGALDSGRDPCLGRILQQSLGRAADARAPAAPTPPSPSSRSA